MLGLFAQSFEYTTVAENDGLLVGIFGGTFLLVWLAILVVVVVGMWKVFEKAGQPGWKSIIPVYNYWVLCEIAGKPGWWSLVFLVAWIPILGGIAAFIVTVLVSLEVAKAFGKDAGFGILLALLPFVGYPLLGFGDAKYSAPNGLAGPQPPTATPPSAS